MKLHEYITASMGITQDQAYEIVSLFLFNDKKSYCDICDKKLTEDESKSIESHHFNFTCIKHRIYAKHFQIGQIRKELGFPMSEGAIMDRFNREYKK